MSLPLVAIVGAPNIGKSTLFNRLVGWRKAIVTDEPGVTRDRNYGEVRDHHPPFRVVDTGGLTPNTAAPFAREILEQAEVAVGEADCVVFVVDARAAATAVDREVAAYLRRKHDRIILVANKVDSERQEELLLDLYDLGLGTPVGVSAAHGRGIDELLDAITEALPAPDPEATDDDEDDAVGVAIVGRPNVGKSSIVNRLLDEPRLMVSDIAGTTRDAVDTRLELDGRVYRLVDTAGMRKRGKVRLSAEASSVVLAKRSLERADVGVLVLDGSTEFAAQDAHVAGYAREALRPMVIAVNKWDLVESREDAARAWADTIARRLRFVPETPIVLVSAKTGQRVGKLLDHVDAAYAAAGIRVPTPDLNRWLRDVAGRERRSPAAGHSVNLLYATQTGVRPPRFVLFCSDPTAVHFSLRRRLLNSLRRTFGFGPAPIALDFRRRR